MARPKRPYKCRACSGKGFAACRDCGGTGNRNVHKKSGRYRRHSGEARPQPEVQATRCDTCRGSGNGPKCHLCKGTGQRES